MKKVIIACLILLSFAVSFAQRNRFPDPEGWVNDYAQTISSEFESKIEGLAVEVERKTGVEMTVVTVENMQGWTVEEYASRLYEAWGIGKRGLDNGVLLLLAMEERKVRIETGYGLEGILPDGRAGEILDRYALPDFRDGAYGSGLYRSLVAVAAIIAEDRGVTITGTERIRFRSERPESRGGSGLFFIIVFVFLMIVTRGRILPWLIFSMMMGSGGRGGSFGGGSFGGGFGGFGGGMSGGGGASRGF